MLDLGIGGGCFGGTLCEPSKRRSGPNGLWDRSRIYLFCRDRFQKARPDLMN